MNIGKLCVFVVCSAEFTQKSQSNTNNEPIEEPQTKKSAPQVNPTNPPVNENEFVTASEDLGKIGRIEKGESGRGLPCLCALCKHCTSILHKQQRRSEEERNQSMSDPRFHSLLFFVQAVVLWLLMILFDIVNPTPC